MRPGVRKQELILPASHPLSNGGRQPVIVPAAGGVGGDHVAEGNVVVADSEHGSNGCAKRRQRPERGWIGSPDAAEETDQRRIDPRALEAGAGTAGSSTGGADGERIRGER